MAYLQIDIGGRPRGLKFSQGTHILVQDKIETFDTGDVKAFGGYAVVWAALKANCIVKGEPVDFTFEQVCEWCDALEEDQYAAILVAYQESVGYKKEELPESGPASDEKKSEATEQNVTALQDA